MLRGEQKVTASHRQRTAIVYIRQSTLVQVREHTESTARQYGLADQAARLGWPATSIEVIDQDLGLSGRSATGRDGFKQLIGQVCMGEVGAVFGLEVSRLARSNADLSRLLELARLTDTLVVDADGISDLADINDRLLLGLKGQMSEAELHLLTSRLQESKRAAARRGELHVPLPVGYVYDDDGQVVIDPDAEVAAAITDIFAAFEATGSAYGVAGAFADRTFPRRAYGGAWAGALRWGRLTHARARTILTNPVYAGAYVFGRRRTRQVVAADGSVRLATVELPRDQWQVLIKDHHSGYISFDQHLAIQTKLAANRTNAGERPPREGTALCQGIVFCGACGRSMQVRYASRHPYYECSHSRADHVATPQCGSVRASTIDQAVTGALLAAVAPDQLALALAAADQVTARRQRSVRAAELAVERARYQADRAERAFHACEPENRLVARSLEARWEARLAELAEAQAALAMQTQTQPELPSPNQLQATVADLPTLWSATTTSDKDRKRLLRTLLGDVTLRPATTDPTDLRVGLRWRSGATEELLVQRARPVTEWRRTSPEAVALARELGPRMSNPELAAALNQAGHTTGTGRPFDATAARNLPYAHRIAAPGLLVDGELTPRAVADRLGVTTSTVHAWLATGELAGRRNPTGRWAISFPPPVETACRARIAASAHIHHDTDGHDRRAGERSIAEVAGHLGIKPDVVYYWAQRSYLPTRRGKSGRRWVAFTADIQAECRQRIANSYKLPDDVKSQATQPDERIAV